MQGASGESAAAAAAAAAGDSALRVLLEIECRRQLHKPILWKRAGGGKGSDERYLGDSPPRWRRRPVSSTKNYRTAPASLAKA